MPAYLWHRGTDLNRYLTVLETAAFPVKLPRNCTLFINYGLSLVNAEIA